MLQNENRNFINSISTISEITDVPGYNSWPESHIQKPPQTQNEASSLVALINCFECELKLLIYLVQKFGNFLS